MKTEQGTAVRTASMRITRHAAPRDAERLFRAPCGTMRVQGTLPRDPASPQFTTYPASGQGSSDSELTSPPAYGRGHGSVPRLPAGPNLGLSNIWSQIWDQSDIVRSFRRTYMPQPSKHGQSWIHVPPHFRQERVAGAMPGLGLTALLIGCDLERLKMGRCPVSTVTLIVESQVIWAAEKDVYPLASYKGGFPHKGPLSSV
jgi:hypothetical protein